MSLILNDIRFLYDGRDLSGDGNTIDIGEVFPMLDATVFPSTAKINRPGQPEGRFSYAGFSQFGVGLVEETLAARKAANVPILAAKAGNAGDRCHFLKALQASLDPIKGKTGDLVGFTIDGSSSAGDGGVIDGIVLESGKTSRVSAGQSAAIAVGATSATQSVYAIIQVLAFVGSSLTLKIQSDDSGLASFVDRFTQAGIAAIGGYYLVPLAGPQTDTHWRVDWSGTFTSFQAAVAIGIR